MDERVISGTAADGRVTVTLSPSGALLGVHIHPGEFVAVDPPGLDNLGDMLVAAFADAHAQLAARRLGPSPGTD
jgi:DNA-binding protein YbaB